jgi:hypothetical protein
MSDQAGSQYIPPIKSRQPGSGVSGNVTKTTSGSIKEGDASSEGSLCKHIGTDVSKQLQTKDVGIHVQP